MLKVTVVAGDRKREAFSNPVINWRFCISTGPRSVGLLSERKYKTTDAAYAAGDRAAKALVKAIKQ